MEGLCGVLHELLWANMIVLLPILPSYFNDYKITKYKHKAPIKIADVIYRDTREQEYSIFEKRGMPYQRSYYVVTYSYTDKEGNERNGSYTTRMDERRQKQKYVYYHPVSTEQHVIDRGGIKALAIWVIGFNLSYLGIRLACILYLYFRTMS